MDFELYIKGLRELFAARANPVDAVFMKRYMKDKFDLFGIKNPLRVAMTKPLLSRSVLPSREELLTLVPLLWDQPEREIQYFTMTLVEKCLGDLAPDDYLLFRYMITNKSWWDTVDFIASHLVGKHMKHFPEQIPGMVTSWRNSGDLWLQRATLLFQLQYKGLTDAFLLESLILQYRVNTDFFMRKAIGWVLREYSKTDAQWVMDLLDRHTLPSLSRREAMKWLQKRNIKSSL